jgi:uncharacterized protein
VSISDDVNAPTVIVARRARPGREQEVEQWLRELATAAEHAPGHLGAAVQPPNEQHPGEWVIVYRFESTTALNDWLSSPRRLELMAVGEPLIDGPTREQIVAMTHQPDPVTAVASFRLLEGHEPALRKRYDALVSVISKFEGFLKVELFEPIDGVQDEAVIVFSFTNRVGLDRWLASDERRDILASIDEHLAGDRTLNVIGGFGGWFDKSGARVVKQWKQAAVVLLALYPISLLLGWLREALLPDIEFAVGTLLGNVIGVALLSWVLMPWLNRRLERWLRR